MRLNAVPMNYAKVEVWRRKDFKHIQPLRNFELKYETIFLICVCLGAAVLISSVRRQNICHNKLDSHQTARDKIML